MWARDQDEQGVHAREAHGPEKAHLHAARVRRRLRRRRQLPWHHRHARRAGQVLQEVAQSRAVIR
ncbi:Beta-galactosidase 11 [Zea mays]|uniref:Beta-galactosidase 11 n=1 Tax=Zea mays TaxID=4577 RepID=A0A1D6QMW5_MAIZE|nr:Beta-galactosidase 11 [Zea mays]